MFATERKGKRSLPARCLIIFCKKLTSPQANVTCTPSTPAPARKRRRPNQDLQERLARCEELLKQYASGSVPIPGAAPAPPAPPAQRPLPPLPATPSNSNLPPSDTLVATPASVDSTQSRNPGSLMVKEDGNVRFMDSYIWASVYDEVSGSHGMGNGRSEPRSELET